MQELLMNGVHWTLAWLSLPEIGLPAIFIISLISATLLPLGSEPVVFGYVSVAPTMFWPAIVVATLGNTLGGAISYWMGLGASRAVQHWKAARGDDITPRQQEIPASGPGLPRPPQSHPQQEGLATAAHHGDPLHSGTQTGGRWHEFSRRWLHRFGPAALLFSWMPVVGDPLCAVAGYLRLPFWPCVVYMAIGKFARYVLMTSLLLWGYTFVAS